MKKQKMSRLNIAVSVVLLAVFIVFLAGVMIWEHNRPGVPVPPETQATGITAATETVIPTTFPPETTLGAMKIKTF